MTTASRHQKRGFLLSLLTLLSLVGAFLGPPVDASASTRVAAGTRARAIEDPATAAAWRRGRRATFWRRPAQPSFEGFRGRFGSTIEATAAGVAGSCATPTATWLVFKE